MENQNYQFLIRKELVKSSLSDIKLNLQSTKNDIIYSEIKDWIYIRPLVQFIVVLTELIREHIHETKPTNISPGENFREIGREHCFNGLKEIVNYRIQIAISKIDSLYDKLEETTQVEELDKIAKLTSTINIKPLEIPITKQDSSLEDVYLSEIEEYQKLLLNLHFCPGAEPIVWPQRGELKEYDDSITEKMCKTQTKSKSKLGVGSFFKTVKSYVKKKKKDKSESSKSLKETNTTQSLENKSIQNEEEFVQEQQNEDTESENPEDCRLRSNTHTSTDSKYSDVTSRNSMTESFQSSNKAETIFDLQDLSETNTSQNDNLNESIEGIIIQSDNVKDISSSEDIDDEAETDMMDSLISNEHEKLDDIETFDNDEYKENIKANEESENKVNFEVNNDSEDEKEKVIENEEPENKDSPEVNNDSEDEKEKVIENEETENKDSSEVNNDSEDKKEEVIENEEPENKSNEIIVEDGKTIEIAVEGSEPTSECNVDSIEPNEIINDGENSDVTDCNEEKDSKDNLVQRPPSGSMSSTIFPQLTYIKDGNVENTKMKPQIPQRILMKTKPIVFNKQSLPQLSYITQSSPQSNESKSFDGESSLSSSYYEDLVKNLDSPREETEQKKIEGITPSSGTFKSKGRMNRRAAIFKKTSERYTQTYIPYEQKEEEEDDISIWDEKKEGNIIFETTESGTVEIASATLNQLVKYLTSSKNHDGEALQTFLLTYTSFTTPKTLFRKLRERFTIPPGRYKNHDSEVIKKKQLRVINVIRKWLELCFLDIDDNLINEVFSFCEMLKNEGSKSLADLIDNVLISKFVGLTKRKNIHDDMPPPPPKLPKGDNPTFEHFHPKEIARQLTIIESRIFTEIKASEFLNQAWNISHLKYRAPHVLQMIETFNVTSSWVSSTIVKTESLNERIKVMSKFIDIAHELFKLNNFNGLMSIISGLQASCVFRLYQTKEGLSHKAQKRLQKFQTLFDSRGNFANYREALKKAQEPVLPYLGIYLTNLVFIEDGNPDNVNGLINFKKRKLVSKVIQRIIQYQVGKRYNLMEVDPIINFLKNLPKPEDENELYNLSLKREPRRTPQQ